MFATARSPELLVYSCIKKISAGRSWSPVYTGVQAGYVRGCIWRHVRNAHVHAIFRHMHVEVQNFVSDPNGLSKDIPKQDPMASSLDDASIPVMLAAGTSAHVSTIGLH